MGRKHWTREAKSPFVKGLKAGLPIGLGYFPVSFTFGFLTVNSGLPVWIGVFISVTNLTSAGQFAGLNMILAGGGYLEIALAVLIINLRYSLMSLSLSQKIKENIPIWKRLIFGYGITDEVFVVASMEKPPITASYMFGLITLPFIGWSLGTLCGGCISGLLPASLQSAMGIAIYAMFIAIIMPVASRQKKVMIIVLVAVALMCAMRYIPIFSGISSGFRIIISTVGAAALGAWLFPVKEEAEDD